MKSDPLAERGLAMALGDGVGVALIGFVRFVVAGIWAGDRVLGGVGRRGLREGDSGGERRNRGEGQEEYAHGLRSFGSRSRERVTV